MLIFLTKRLLQGVGTLFIVSAVIFLATTLLPGDVATAMLGQLATEDAVSALRISLGLDQPIHLRYVQWLSGIVTGDLGISLASGRPVAPLVLDRLSNTLLLAAVTTVIAVPLALALGIISALHANRLPDRCISVGVLATVSVPEYFIATILIILLAVNLGWFPATSRVTGAQGAAETMRAIALPAATLCLAVMAHMVRMVRATILDVLDKPFIETAILKGLTRRDIVLHHALPNAWGPICNVIALNLTYLVAGVVIVETIFSFPGLGKVMIDAVSSRDIPVVQACAILFCGFYILLNLLADVCAILSNPRLRTAR